MNATQKRITVAVILAAIGISSAVLPLSDLLAEPIVASVCALFAVTLILRNMIVERTRGNIALLVTAYLLIAVGAVLMVNRFLRFIDSRYLTLVGLVPVGVVMVVLSVTLRKFEWSFWVDVLIAGIGVLAGAFAALYAVREALAAFCIAGVVVAVRPLVLAAYRKNKEKREKNKNVYTVKEKDIEIIYDDEEK